MTTVIDAAKQHSRFGGSVCDQYMNCAGSVALCASLPKRPEDAYAKGGTAAHKLGEACLRQRLHPTHFLGERFHGVEVDQAMCDAVVTYLNVVETEIARTRTAEYFVEQDFVLDISGAEPGEVHGMNDCLVYHPETGRLRVFDYKHGIGETVDVEENKQLKFYAAGAVFSHPEWRISEVVLTIVQPRAWDQDDGDEIKDWSFNVVDLLEFQGELETAIARAKMVDKLHRESFELAGTQDAAGSVLKTGSWCRWCAAAAMCPAKDATATQAATLDKEGITSVTEVTAAALPEPKALDGERLAKIVAGLDILTEWANRCRDYLQGMVLSGQDVPGWKAVEKIGRAKWIDDPNQIVAYGGMVFDLDADQLMPPRIVTIGDAEKLLKAAGATKDQIDDFKLRFTIKESSGLTVAPASDRRPAVNAVASNFGTVNTAALAAE